MIPMKHSFNNRNIVILTNKVVYKTSPIGNLNHFDSLQQGFKHDQIAVDFTSGQTTPYLHPYPTGYFTPLTMILSDGYMLEKIYNTNTRQFLPPINRVGFFVEIR